MTALIVPALLVIVALCCVARGVDLYAAMSAGARDGFSVIKNILPSLIVLLTAVSMLRASGALAVGSELMTRFGPDSYLGRCAATMLGSTETTFYVIAVYFGAAGIKKTRHAVPAALVADLVGFISAAFFVRLFFA